jgi:hypothetical protein
VYAQNEAAMVHTCASINAAGVFEIWRNGIKVRQRVLRRRPAKIHLQWRAAALCGVAINTSRFHTSFRRDLL